MRSKGDGVSESESSLDLSDSLYTCNNFQASTKPVSCLISRASLLIGDSAPQHSFQSLDLCGLNSHLDADTDTEEDSQNVTEKVLHSGKSLFLKKRVNNNDIKQKFHNLETEHKRIHLQMKCLQNNVMKKEHTVQELTAENDELREKCEILIMDLNEKNTNLVEFASVNHSLEKQLDQKNAEIKQLQTQLEKGNLIQSNLLKDIDYYKSELNRYKDIQLHTPQDYEDLRKKFVKLKRENANLEKRCKDLKTLDAENAAKNTSYMVISKRFESLQNEILKYRMENKKLKAKHSNPEKQSNSPKKSSQVFLSNFEMENRMLKETILNCEQINIKLNTEIDNVRINNQQLEKELKDKDSLTQEMQEKLSVAATSLDELKVNLESTETQTDLLQDKINIYQEKCEALEKEVESLRNINAVSSSEASVFKDDINQLKIRLAELVLEKETVKTDHRHQNIQTDVSEYTPLIPCLNCVMLKKELEKLGYANFKLNKEKTCLKVNFQKLSVKTSRLELKVDELNTDKSNNNISIVDHRSRASLAPELLLQQNLILSKKLQDIVDNYDRLLKDYICLQQERMPTNIKSSSAIMQELQDHLCNSHFCIQSIEHKLNTEEGKLNASLYHLRAVKDKLSERKMALKY